MNVASLELCKELFELSGWGENEFGGRDKSLDWWEHFDSREDSRAWLMPKYDAGYLLRKLPVSIKDYFLALGPTGVDWTANYEHFKTKDELCAAGAYTPEDAIATLAIELFKLGILTK